MDVPEVVINIVNYSMVQQASLASVEYPKGVNEFIKAGFTQVPSTMIKPPRVGESPVSFECKVLQVIKTGDQGAAGNLVICEILLAHIKDEVLDAEGKVDPFKVVIGIAAHKEILYLKFLSRWIKLELVLINFRKEFATVKY
jgi:flavin reductase (DIM6/NTAB) family NADH-FMN oxidoreductase RutF